MSDDRQFGEGQDNYLQGIRSAAEAAKQAGSAAGSVGTAAGEATANAAAATVQAGMETGKAASEIAVGTAAGGPWGAVLSAAWSLRHTLFKVLVFLCLFLLFIIITVVSLPSIVFNNIFHTDPTTVDPNGPTEMTAIFDDLSATVADCIQAGYDAALAEVDEIIADGGYDYDLSMEALVNNALVSMDYDTCYILAAYSASMGQRGTTKADLQSKLNAVTDQMYTVTYEVKSTQVPVENEGGDGETQETVQYVACTIHPFDQSIILKAFDVDVDATYDQFQISYGDAILNMSNALKMTMYGTASIEEPEDYRGQPRGDVLHYLLNKRLGAEVDYIVKGVDQENNVVAASRLEAMALKRREYYFRTDRDGNYQIYEGIRAEARVISVIRAGIFIDLFGAECYIPLRELSYQRWVDAAQHYQPGQRVLVKVLEVDRSDRSHPRVSASVKQAMENPYEKALKKYVVGNRYVGTVSMVDLNGVFVSLDGGVDCLCTYPKRGRPPRGARATVRILGINHENNRIWGVITHMSTTR